MTAVNLVETAAPSSSGWVLWTHALYPHPFAMCIY